MKKKIIGIFVCTLLMITMSMSVIGEQQIKVTNCTNQVVREILYHEDHGSGIWRMKEDGTAKVEVLNHGWFATHYGINTIAFGEYYNGGICIMNSGGVRIQTLANVGDAPHGCEVLGKIVYHVGGTDPTERRVWILDIASSNAQLLTDKPGHFAEFSPDGQWIAYQCTDGYDIWLIKPDGTGGHKLVDNAANPTWDRTSTYIAYQNYADGLIWKIKMDGTGAQQLSEFKGTHPDWEPLGDYIVYEYYEQEPSEGIRAVKSDGTDDHPISNTGHAPRWHNFYNNPCSTPIITGPQNGNANTAYEYTFNSVDPEGDDVHYFIEWGDNTNTGLIGPYPSGQDVKIFHTYTAEDSYQIQAMAHDTNAYESDWNTLDVTMPRTKEKEDPKPFGFILAFGTSVDVKIVQLEPGEDYVDLEILNKNFYIWDQEMITFNPGVFLRLYETKGLFTPSLPFCIGICSDYAIIG